MGEKYFKVPKKQTYPEKEKQVANTSVQKIPEFRSKQKAPKLDYSAPKLDYSIPKIDNNIPKVDMSAHAVMNRILAAHAGTYSKEDGAVAVDALIAALKQILERNSIKEGRSTNDG